MKNIIKLVFSILVLSMLFTLTISCENLERFPSDEIETSQSFQKISDAESWNNGMYATLRGNLYGNSMYTLDVQADQLNASLTFGNRNGGPHRWSEFFSTDRVLLSVWLRNYKGIADANLAINNLKNIETKDASEVAAIKRYEGEAYFFRAFYYHNLVVRFGKMYDPSSANTDLAVPIYLDFDVNELGERKMVKEVYTQILNDIAEAKKKMSAVSGSSGATRLSIDTIKALEARVKFYMQEWKDAKSIADELIASGTYPLTKTEEEFKAMWHKDDYHQEVITALSVSAPNELPNTNSVYLGLIPVTGNFAPDFIPSQWVIDKYEDNDFRKKVYFEQKTVEQNAVTYPNIWLVNKYPGNPELYSGVTNYAHSPILFRIAEMYLISAESASNLSQEEALAPLNTLRTARNLLPLTNLSSNELTVAIRDERFRELAFEGFRLDDLRRWGQGFSRKSPQNIDLINRGSSFDQLVIEAGNPKFTWGIPSLEISTNDNIQDKDQNSGW